MGLVSDAPAVSRLAEYAWDFDGEDADWQWLVKEANFSHRDACEFIVHIGNDPEDDDADPPYWKFCVKRMIAAGCSNEFIAAYVRAKEEGAMRVLFFA